VAELRVAWSVRTGDFPPEVFEPGGHRAQDRTERGTPFRARTGAPCGACHNTQTRFEATPVLRDGRLYVSTPLSRVLAIHAGTGSIHWTFDPRIDLHERYAEDWISRGVALWSDPTDKTRPCALRVFLATVDARLFALDAADGRPCAGFGQNGFVRLGEPGADNDPTTYTVTSPPAVLGNTVVVGSAVSHNGPTPAPSGTVRAYDARTGENLWSFEPIPRSADHPAANAWDLDAAKRTGAGNAWSMMSVDTERDLLVVPTASAAPDHYGGDRPGTNAFANSIVALRGSTGEVVWAFQVVHHDLWDYDVATQPILLDLRRDGRVIPSVVIGTKMGMLFIVHRETGEPLSPVIERAVPSSDVPGEAAWPTQPFPRSSLILHSARLTADSAFGITEADRAFCREEIGALRNDGIFTPPSLAGTLVWPGFWGGLNWDGMAWDPERQLLVITLKRLGMVLQLQPRGQPGTQGMPAEHYFPQGESPYGVTRRPLVSPSGIPCTPPPWGELITVDLAREGVRWRRPLGVVPWLVQVRGSETWGSLLFGGPLVTASGLVFVAAAQDDRIRAFDVEDGSLVWEHELPAGGQAAPLTYVHDGRQFVVIAAGGRAGIGSPGDWIVAFALPGND
jgi:quinoprotein glucose dehydrogenase